MLARRPTSSFVLACLALLPGDTVLRAAAPPAAPSLPQGVLARLGPKRPQKKDAVQAIAFSSDGKTLGSAHSDHTLRVWDVGTRTERVRFNGPDKPVIALAFARDGKTVLAASSAGAGLWSVPAGHRTAKLDAKDRRLLHAAFAPDGQALAWLEDDRHTLHVWDVGRGRSLRRFAGHSKRVLAVDLAADGRTFASSGEDGVVRVWDLATGKELRRLEWLEGQKGFNQQRYLGRMARRSSRLAPTVSFGCGKRPPAGRSAAYAELGRVVVGRQPRWQDHRRGWRGGPGRPPGSRLRSRD
jgi:hypothetical protein